MWLLTTLDHAPSLRSVWLRSCQLSNSCLTSAITTANSGEKVFVGPVDDPFFVDLGWIFDLGDAPRQTSHPVDGLKCKNVSTIALQIPIAELQKDHKK